MGRITIHIHTDPDEKREGDAKRRAIELELEIDLEEEKEERRRNFEARLAFIDRYVEWLKKTPNKEWSKQQNELIDR